MSSVKIRALSNTAFLEKYGIVLILILFVCLSIVGIFYNYPLPNTVADETVLMAAALKMIAEQSLRPNYPTNYHMPLGVYIYLPFFVALFIFLRILGVFTSMEALKEFGILHYGKLLPMARFISVLLGAASVYLVYKICQKLFDNKFVSLIAPLLLATNLMFVQMSHYGRVWLPQIFVILLTFYFIACFYKKEQVKFRDYFKIAFLTAVSFGTHFIGILIYLPFLAAHYLRNKEKSFKEIFITNRSFWLSNLVIIVLLLFVYYLNPYGFINYVSQSAKAGTAVLNDAADLGGTIDFWTSLTSYGKVLFENGPILVMIFVISLIPLFFYKRNLFFVFNSFILGYYIVIGPVVGSSSIKEHYIAPIIPFMAIIAAYGIDLFYKSNFFGRNIKTFLIAAIFIYPLYLAVLWDYKATQPSTLVLAQEWIHTNLPQGARVVNFNNAILINENKQSIEDVQTYAPNDFLRRQRYLLSLDDEKYPKPNYYVLTMSNYKKGIPDKILNKNWDYVVISWGNKMHYAKAMEDARRLFGLKQEDLIKIFPSGADSDTFSVDLEIWRRPLYNLRKMNHIGPVVAVYKLRSKSF